MIAKSRGFLASGYLLFSLLLHTAWEVGSGQVHYSVLEEAKHGTFVGRIAQDLGLEVGELVSRLFRVVSKGRRDYLEVNVQNGILFVNSRIDREELCGPNPVCSIHLEVIVDKPLQVFHVEVEIKDINDNPPVFSATQKNLFISESTPLESRFPLEGASDADIGENALLTYSLNPNEYFILDVKKKDEKMNSLKLVLKKVLDREETTEHNLLLTATDGGKPELTGTIQLLITVLDVNDNTPEFERSVYKVRLFENVPDEALVTKMKASDLDEGLNAEITYSFTSDVSPNVQSKFHIDHVNGEIKIKGNIDFEETKLFEFQVEATDKGSPRMVGHCTVLVEIIDINDNAPEISVTSLSLPVRENAPSGTVIALISVSDRDSGANGQVTCSLSPSGPFTLVSTFRNYYSLVLEGPVDRESVPDYELVVTARDGGTPALWATASVSVDIGDVNDNAPAFDQPVYTVFLRENNPPGCHIFTVSASDPDAQENALVSYSLVERRVGERPLSSYVSVHAESGKLYALQPLDHEELELLAFQVRARDSGFPPLNSNVSLQVFVLDENDNPPVVLPPHSGLSPVTELVSQSVTAGHVVAKIRAVDADSGYNAWLSYELLPEVGVRRCPFRVGLYTGEISTTRALEESDGPKQKLLVLVKDHGDPVLSATATVLVSLVASGQTLKTFSAGHAKVKERVMKEAPLVDINVYLIIAICSVSSLLVLSLLFYAAMRCSAPLEGLYCARKPTVVSSNDIGSLCYSQQRQPKICSGEGVAKRDLMAFSPNFPPCLGDRSQQQEMVPEPSGKPKQPNPDWRYSASLRAGMHSSVHLEEAGILRAGPGGPDQQWPTVSSATPEPEAGEVSPPVGAGVNSNSWTFKYGPGNPKQPGPGELPDKFIIPGSPAIISIRQEPPNSQIDKSDFITFGKKEETKKKKKKKKGNKTQEKKEKGNSTTDNSDQ
ncbi:protocadherin alpha-3-like isoform X7 [Dromiciops gliroides]|uniref:protocadherin alpha-3-like isoform X7 n=1 Tax=Dromiciops gliroides TaxID=33562 RepID=UPI001CC40220|nr:protocadherin alpha-3-like isoform X7 [Dromiciops gliroides]